MTQPFNLLMLSAGVEQGGNTLQRFLDGHPQLLVYPTESKLGSALSSNLIIPGAARFEYGWPEFTTEMSPHAALESIYDEELKTYMRTPERSKFKGCGLVVDEAKRIACFAADCVAMRETRWDGNEQRQNTRAQYIEAFFRSTFDASNWTRTGRETHYVGYSPWILFDADKMMSDFRSGHMVHIVRNPFSGYSDTKKRPFPMGAARYGQLWNVTQLMAATYEAKYRGRFHVVRFEDLVANPMGTLSWVAQECGLEPFATLPRPSFNRVPLETVHPWGTIKHATPSANLATAHELSKAESAAVYAETQEMIARWYSPVEILPFQNLA